MELPPPRPTLLRRLTRRVEQAKALKGWIEEARGRSLALDVTFETIERDSRIGGVILAGALCYRLFVFALPLAVFLVSGLGLLADAFGTHPHGIVNSIGLTGQITKQIEHTSTESSNWWVAITSFFVLVYATRNLLRALAIVHALAWTGSAASIKVKPRSLAIFGGAVVGQLALVAGQGAVRHQSPVGGIITLIVFVLADAGLWLIVSLQLPHANARWTDLIPGSLFYAIGIVCVQIFNILILARLLQEKSSTYGALGIAAALLLSLFLAGRVMVGAAALNATLYERRTRQTSPHA
jgi:membrane protein